MIMYMFHCVLSMEWVRYMFVQYMHAYGLCVLAHNAIHNPIATMHVYMYMYVYTYKSMRVIMFPLQSQNRGAHSFCTNVRIHANFHRVPGRKMLYFP